MKVNHFELEPHVTPAASGAVREPPIDIVATAVVYVRRVALAVTLAELADGDRVAVRQGGIRGAFACGNSFSSTARVHNVPIGQVLDVCYVHVHEARRRVLDDVRLVCRPDVRDAERALVILS